MQACGRDSMGSLLIESGEWGMGHGGLVSLRKRILTVPFLVLEIKYICTVKYCVCKYSYKYNMYYYIWVHTRYCTYVQYV